MGNSHSQHHQTPNHQWTHSYPRPRHIPPQVKVLPERIPPLRLRTTDNGAILHNGGTISCRKQSLGEEEMVCRPRSSSAHRPPKPEDITLNKTRFGSEPDLRFHLKEAREKSGDHVARQRASRSRKKYKAPPAPQNGMHLNMNGIESSSPDLNGWDSKDGNAAPVRRTRLFKTRAETNKKNMAVGKKIESEEIDVYRATEDVHVSRPRTGERKLQQSTKEEKVKSQWSENKGLKRSASHEVITTKKTLVTPEFQAELVRAAQRLKPLSEVRRNGSVNGKTETNKILQVPEDGHLKPTLEVFKENGFASNKTPQHQPEDTSIECNRNDNTSRDVPCRKFYFGMEENNNELKPVNYNTSTNNVTKTNTEHRITAVEKSKNLMNMYKSINPEGSQEWEDSVDRFAASFHKSQVHLANGNTTSCSSSFVSDPDEDVVGGIALQLRPTLPKKQLEIPRFSPTAAWRLLSSIDPQSPSTGESDEGPLVIDDGIHLPVSHQVLRNVHDKSGDSGISGDASPGGCHESSSEIAVTSAKTMATQNSKNLLMAWTPQQDLEEESSSDDLESPVNSSKNTACNIPGAKFSPRSQLFMSRDQSFSLPVPREEQLSLYTENNDSKGRNILESTPKLNSLKKLTVGLGASKRSEVVNETHSQNDNWVLSRSVPSSLGNSHPIAIKSLSNPSSPEQDDEYFQQNTLKHTSYSYLASGGRMMYLPEYHSRMSPDVLGKRPRSKIYSGFLSKSCENIMQSEMKQVTRSRTPSPIVSHSNDEAQLQSEGCRAKQKKKKFTFQSTVRLIENRRIAEKLSREAELKENQRLSEVEAMKKVEEEFQKKRAREKANIRQQLRLFNLEEKNYSSLPLCDWGDNRVDPEGAPFSLPSDTARPPERKISANRKPSLIDVNKYAPSTQVLSEYREPMRNYRDYRHFRYHEPQELSLESNRKSVVEHPKMVYDMPKNTAVYVSAPVNSSAQNHFEGRNGVSTSRSPSSDNYRKDFAHGVLISGGRSITSSDSELSQSRPESISRKEVTSRRLDVGNRSRSASLESLSRSDSPQTALDVSTSPLGSRSTSPVKIVINHKTKIITGNNSKSVTTNTNRSSNFEQVSISNFKFPKKLERKLSNSNEYFSSTGHLDMKTGIRNNPETEDGFTKCNRNSLRRVGLSSLQPFNKTEKSFRPINFNPAINKVAQTVT